MIYICKRKVNKIKFIDCVNKIISDYTYEQIRWYFYIYLIQNKQIKEKQTSIDFFKIPEPFKTIFIDFFYNKFFSNDKIWSFWTHLVFLEVIFTIILKMKTDYLSVHTVTSTQP